MSGRGWRADISPDSCPAAAFDFDFIAGASGKTGSDSFKGISKIILHVPNWRKVYLNSTYNMI